MIITSGTGTHKFASDIILVAVAQILLSLTGLTIFAVLTKSFNTSIYGIWVQANATVFLLSPIINLYFSNAIIRFASSDQSREKKKHILGTMLLPIIIFASVSLVTSTLLANMISELVFADIQFAYFIPLLFLWLSLDSVSALFLSYLRAQGKIKMLALIQIFMGMINLLIIITLAITGHPMKSIIMGMIFYELILITITLFFIIKDIGFPILSFENIGNYLKFGLPQIASGILLWIIGASDKYFITHYLELSQTGIYSASYSIGTLIYLLFQPISFVLFPTISRYWEQSEFLKVKTYMEFSTHAFIILAMPAVFGLCILSQPLLALISSTQYQAGKILVLLLALGSMMTGIYQINVTILFLQKKTHWLPPIIAAAGIVSIGINATLIPHFGIIAAGISNIISLFILATIIYIIQNKLVHFQINIRLLIKAGIASLLMAGSLWFIPVSTITSLVFAIFCGILIYLSLLIILKVLTKDHVTLIKNAMEDSKNYLFKF
jgi:O-antigen/teichoic acid export membrane protein